jgi:hypothetical protein
MASAKGGVLREGGEGAWRYVPKEGEGEAPVRFVSRVNAARYCNWLSKGGGSADSESGVYRIGKRVEDGRELDAVIGYRDLSSLDGRRLYALPLADEWYKAGFFQGPPSNSYRSFQAEELSKPLPPSRYGVENQGGGVMEWAENRFWRQAFALGGCDSDKMPDKFSGKASSVFKETSSDENLGFRLMATPALQVCENINANKNFVTEEGGGALFLRWDGEAASLEIALKLRSAAGKLLWSQTRTLALKPGLNKAAFEIPKSDGWYCLEVAPAAKSYEGASVEIPFAVCLESMPQPNAAGRFGAHVDVKRWEEVLTFEPVDRERFRQMGASVLRGAGERELAQGYAVVAELPSNYGRWENAVPPSKELARKWAAEGVPANFASYAEAIYDKVSASKGLPFRWELGNEPQYWRMPSEDYAQIAKWSALAAKKADPSCKLVLGDMSSIHDAVLPLGAAAFCDGVATHIYGFYSDGFWGVAGKMRALNGALRANGASGKEIWVTETGMCNYSARHLIPLKTLRENWLAQSLTLPKLMLGEAAFGATKVVVYNYRDVPLDYLEGEFGLMDRYGYPKPAFMAFRTAARLFGEARFEGFAKLPDAQERGMTGLAFRDKQGRLLLALWRNDRLSSNDFSKPFKDVVGPAETLSVPCSGEGLELVDAFGASRRLAAVGGAVEVPVDEWPCYLRGDMELAFKDVPTAFAYPVEEKSPGLLKIMPSAVNPGRACDLLQGFALNAVPGSSERIRVRLYNLSQEALKGSVTLRPRGTWRQFRWKFSPERVAIEVPPGGMATAEFSLEVPVAEQGKEEGDLLMLDAFFSSSGGGPKLQDSVPMKKGRPQWDSSAWRTWTNRYKVKFDKSGEYVSVSWPEKREASFNFVQADAPLLASKEGEMNRSVKISFRYGSSNLKAVSLLLRDASNEIFKLRGAAKPKLGEDGSGSESFRLADFLKASGRLSSWGGSNDKKLDLPVKLEGFVFDFDASQPDAGKIELLPPEID